jgi:hypothetical protein
MSFLTGLSSFFGEGGFGKELVGFIRDRWPPNMSEGDRAAAEFALQEFAHQKELSVQRLALEQDQEFSRRIADLEGTAGDLKALPFFGGIIIFLRGAFRPVFSYYVAYLDYSWLSGQLELGPVQESTMYALNLLVLGFFFGERAVKNLAPVLAEFMKTKSSANGV